MQLWKSILAYDGTNFHGWQVQPGLPTVQGTLAQALHHITGESVLPQGSGRTDTGVHALAQVATFTLAAPIPPQNLHRALNRALPPSIRILSVTHAPDHFHARHSALRKTYEYRLFPRVVVPTPGEPAQPDRICPPFLAHRPTEHRLPHGGPDRICPPFLAPYAWDYPFPFNLAAANEAAAQILGTHDFTSFAASDPDLTTRTTSPPSSGSAPNGASEPDSPQFGLSSRGEAEGPASASPLSPRTPPLSFRSKAEASAVASSPFSQSHKPVPHSSQPHRDEWDPPQPSPNTRTIHHSLWTHHEDLYLYRVTGSGFLHHMVRNLVGTFTDAASGRIPPSAVRDILAARNRSAAGPTAPARGLFLVEVEYE